MFGAKEVSNLSSNGTTPKEFVTREPFLIFTQIKNVKDDKEKKEEIKQLLDALRIKFPDGFKIGAAVGGGDSFFDSIAQGLNELKDKGLITDNREDINIKSLRESCKQYAQSKRGTWFNNILKREGRDLTEYISHIEFTAEDIEDTRYSSKRKKLKVDKTIMGRLEVEGKMISEKYGIKIKAIELTDEINGLCIAKGKVGKGNTIYIVNYKNHYIPLLSNIKKDIKKCIKVFKKEAYGNMLSSKSNSNQVDISMQSQDFLLLQSGHSTSPSKEKARRKRRHSVTDKEDLVSKKQCMDVTSNEVFDSPCHLQDNLTQNELSNSCRTKQHIPHHLIGLMYQLDVSVLCLLRKSVYEQKYSSLSLFFDDYEVDKFNNIVLRYKNKSIHIQIQNVDKYFIENSISYASLFSKDKQSSFFINDYFNSFVKHLINKSNSLTNNIEYLIIFTNSRLDFAEEGILNKGRFKNFYPFKFDSIDMEKFDIIKDFLFTNDNMQGSSFYQFSQDKLMRKELIKRLKFSPTTLKVLKEEKNSKEIKKRIIEEFLDKLIFAVNQPSREKLNSIIKDEIKKSSKVQHDYLRLQEEVLCNLIGIDKLKNDTPETIYKLNLLIFFFHCVFLHKKFFLNLAGTSSDISNIIINYKDRAVYIKTHDTYGNISYAQLFPSKKQERNNTFSINKHLSLFVEEFQNDMRYFVIYTNTDLDITEEKELKKVRSQGFYPIKFENIDIETFEILKYFMLIDDNIKEHSFYQFSKDEITREQILKRLEFSPATQKVAIEKNICQEEIKKAFLDKLVFAVNQPSKEKLNNIIKNEIEKNSKLNKVAYNYEELHEIALRWLESREFSLTKNIITRLFEDIQNNRSSFQKIRNEKIDEEIKFARSVVGREGTFAFDLFLDFLMKREGNYYLEVLNRNKISLSNISSILHGSGEKSVRAFKDLYNCWFDKNGNKMQYLKSLEEEGISLVNMSSILHGARADAAKTFEQLYSLWFDQNGRKTQYLTNLTENGVDLVRMSSILSGAGVNASRAFIQLYNLWFDQNGIKTQYLTKLEENGVDLVRMSSILNGAGANASRAFKDLFHCWFDKEGNKMQCLKTLEKEGISLAHMSSVLHRAGNGAAQAFQGLYDSWFDSRGEKTQYLTRLRENKVDLVHMSSILSGAGSNASRAFKHLYDLWFDESGNKTQYLTKLGENGVNLVRMSSILSGSGVNASRAFKGLYNLWFDEEGNKMQCLYALEKEGINLSNMSSILHRAGNGATQAFKDLYSLWFDKGGNKTQYLKTLEKEKINLFTVSSILHGAGSSAAKAFKDLYDLWLDKKGNKKQCLQVLERNGIDLANICCILGGTGANVAKVFTDLYNVWFDEQGNKKPQLKHFTKNKDKRKRFTMFNLSSILGGTGPNAAKAFEELHDVCFDDKGKRKKLLDDFYNENFKPSNLSCILCKTGVHASFILKGLHSVCFNGKRKKTKLLRDFFNASFRRSDLCSILSGAADKIEKFHNFCFISETKKYLNHFLKEGFTPKNLSNILHGARANICSAFKDLHDFCFDDKGERAEPLVDFYKAGFTLNNLSVILCMAGSNATSIFRDFHKSCFGKQKYLHHFLTEKKIFTPENLSKILYGAGNKTYAIFEKLHNICFDELGSKTYYLDNLIKDNQPNDIINILYKQVRKGSATSLDQMSIQQLDSIEENEIDDPL